MMKKLEELSEKQLENLKRILLVKIFDADKKFKIKRSQLDNKLYKQTLSRANVAYLAEKIEYAHVILKYLEDNKSSESKIGKQKEECKNLQKTYENEKCNIQLISDTEEHVKEQEIEDLILRKTIFGKKLKQVEALQGLN